MTRFCFLLVAFALLTATPALAQSAAEYPDDAPNWRPFGDAVFESEGAIEVLDSPLVNMGVGMINDRVIPSDAVIADGKQLLAELHDAFTRDLAEFRASLSGP